MYVAPGPVSDVIVHNETVTSSTLTLTWMEMNVANSDFSHYTVFYLPVKGPYGPIMASNRRKRLSVQAGELAMNFTDTTGTLTDLYGAVTYRIQVAAVATFNGRVLNGDRSDAIEITTFEGGEQICTCTCKYNSSIFLNFLSYTVPTAPRNLNYLNLTNSSVTLTWSRPDPPHGIITQYNVSNISYLKLSRSYRCFMLV